MSAVRPASIVRSRLEALLPHLIAFLGGALSWLYLMRHTHRREAWDSPIYFNLLLPALMLLAAGLGYFRPHRAWRWGVWPFAAQAFVAFVQDPTANLLPLGLIAFAIFSIPCALCGQAGAWFRRVVRPDSPPTVPTGS